MSPRRWLITLSCTIGVLFTASSANAAPITFTFDTEYSKGKGGTLVFEVDGLTATIATGAIFNNYTGDGHVVGPMNGKSVTPYTLGTTDGGVYHKGFDNFIVNKSPHDRFTVTFSEKVYSVAFDYEIFPNGHEGVNNPPDMTFVADGDVIAHYVGEYPVNGPFQSSPWSLSHTKNGVEPFAQLLGTSKTFNFPNGVTELVFIDWPILVGIDNLAVTTAVAPVPMPEPASFLPWMICAASLGLVIFRVRRSHVAPVV